MDVPGQSQVSYAYDDADQLRIITQGTSVVSFAYEMVYERDGRRSRATGRDLWVFARQQGGWLAVWRTMLDLAEQPAEPPHPLPEPDVGSKNAGLAVGHLERSAAGPAQEIGNAVVGHEQVVAGEDDGS